MRKRSLIGVFLACLLAVLVSFSVSSASSGGLTPHDPIVINGDGDFTEANGVVNPGASGTEGDPYVIEGWVIDASDNTGIDVTWTKSHFVIRNCVIENGEKDNYYQGIYLHYLQDGYGIVENNRLLNNNGGVVFYHAPNCISRNNLFISNSASMRIRESDNSTVQNNRSENDGGGYEIRNSSNVTFSGNSITGTTYKPAFELLSVSNCVLDNNTLEGSSSGIALYDSSNNTIKNNVIEQNFGYGLSAQSSPDVSGASSNNQIYRNYFMSNGMKRGDVQAYDQYTNTWSVTGAGNYWSDWQPPEHPDSNGDGVVDEPKSIGGGSNVDNYPLVFPEGYTGGVEDNDSVQDNAEGGDGGVTTGEGGGTVNILLGTLIMGGGLVVAYSVRIKSEGGRTVAVAIIVIAAVAVGGFVMISEEVGINLIGDGVESGGGTSEGSGGGGTGGGGTGNTTGLPVYSGASEVSLSSNAESALIYGCEGVPRDVYETSDSLTNVKSWYKSAMNSNGWSLSMEGDYSTDYKSKWYKSGKEATVWILTQEMLTAQEMNYSVEIDISGTAIVLSSWNEGEC